MYKVLILISMIVFCACSSGKKQLAKGNYTVSIEQAVNRLKRNPNNKKAKATLKDAHAFATKAGLRNIDELRNSNERFKWDRIADSYDQLNRMYDLVWSCPACVKIVPDIKNYRNEFNEASNAAAEERYVAGLEELKRGTRENAIQAYRHFERVNYLRPGYKDVNDQMDRARELATLKVLVDQIPVHSARFGLSHEFFQNRIYEYLERSRPSEFVRFYSPVEASRLGVNRPDHVVILQFDDFVVGQTVIRERTREVSRDSVVVGTVEVDGESKDVYGSVDAELTTYSKYLDSKGLLDMRIYDGRTERVLFQRKMPGRYEWLTEWATYKGDKRALTDEELALTELQEVPPPSPQFLFEQFCLPIYDQVAGNFIQFYRNY